MDFAQISQTAQLDAPWTGILKSSRTESRTARQVMEDAGLAWRCEARGLRTEDGLLITSHKAVVRETDNAVLGVVTRGYNILQNSESFGFVDSLVDDGHLTYQGAGTVDNGRSIFIQGRLPDGGEVAPGDTVWPYLAFVNRHDGGGSIIACLTSVRIICGNTQRAAIREGKASNNAICVRHTKNMRENLGQAREVFGWATTNFGGYLTAARSLVKKNVTNVVELRKYFENVLEASKIGEAYHGRTQTKLSRLEELFETGAGNADQHVRGTYWAALNAVTQYVDHEAPSALRGEAAKGLDESQRAEAIKAKRFESSQLGAGADTKDRAFELALAA